MRFFQPLQYIIFILSTLTLSTAYALDVTVVDQDGAPLADAYIAIPSGSITAPPTEHAVMDQVDVAFVPHVLAIHKGQSVIFPNSDNIRHHVYSFSEPKRFEIKLYQGVPNNPILFDKPGLVALGCNIHDSMLGYIFVSPWPNFTVTDTSGQVSFETDTKTLAVWHPWLKGQTNAKEIDISNLIIDGKATITLNVTRPTPIKSFRDTRRLYND